MLVFGCLLNNPIFLIKLLAIVNFPSGLFLIDTKFLTLTYGYFIETPRHRRIIDVILSHILKGTGEEPTRVPFTGESLPWSS